MTMRKGKVFLSRMQKQTEQDNPCLWFPLFLLRFQQEPGRYTSDRTNLGTSAAPNNCQYNPIKLKFTILLFLEQPFNENYPTLDSCDTRPFTRHGGFQNRQKGYSVAYGSTKIESF